MGDKVPEELRKESLDDYRMGLLKELKEWIYRQRVKARQERRRMERAKAKAEAVKSWMSLKRMLTVPSGDAWFAILPCLLR